MSRKIQYKTYGAEEAIQSAYIYADYREYVDSVCAELGLPKITVKDGRRCRRALYYKQHHCIVLPKWSEGYEEKQGRNLRTLLVEDGP